MSYVKPTDVHAPKRFWSLIHVIFDGGPGESSLAIGRWENKPVLVMRWNGTDDNPLGNPQSRGLPTWFVVPEQHWKQILETEHYAGIKENTLNLARNFLQSKRVYFLNRCPNPQCREFQKLVLHEYQVEEIDDILDKLRRNELRFYHIICDGSWSPSVEDKTELANVLTAAREEYRRGAGETLTAHLLDNGGFVQTQLRLPGSILPLSNPQQIEMLHMKLNNNPYVTEAEKEVFLNELREKGTAQIFLPHGISKFSAG